MKLNSKLILSVLGALVLAVPVTIYAHNTNNNTVSTGYEIDPGETKDINAHGTCKSITNNSNDPLLGFDPKDFFVPTSKPEEWLAFINNLSPPEEIGIGECGTVTGVPTSSSGSDIYYHYYIGEEPGNFWD